MSLREDQEHHRLFVLVIDHDSHGFFARCTYAERLAFSQAGWLWDAGKKRWATDDMAKVVLFEPFATDAAFKTIGASKGVALGAMALSHAESADIKVPAPPGLSYDPHQLAAILYASQHADTLVADPPGLGKTIEAIGLSNYLPEIRRVLVVPPAHLRVNWAREWKKWCVKGLTVGTAGSITKRARMKDQDGNDVRDQFTNHLLYRQWTEHVWPDTDVVICNYDMLPVFHDQIRQMLWDLLIVDESHALVSEGSIRTRHVLGGGKQKKHKDGKVVYVPAVTAIPADRRLLMTGTPIMSKPIDLWPTLRTLDPDGLGKNWKSFTRKYCGGQEIYGRYDTSGATNLEELQVKLRLSFMIRRDKTRVMLGLPPKRRQLIELPAEGLAKLAGMEMSAMRRVRDALASFEHLDVAQEEVEWTSLADALERRFGHLANLDYTDRFRALTAPEQVAFEELSVARRELAAAKIPMVIEHLKTYVDAGVKVIVGCVHTAMADALYAAFPSAAFITGKVPPNKRQAQVDRFQDDPACNPMIANMIAGGTGYTMTASSLVVCAELEWVPALVEQFEDRAWRRGQPNSVLCQHLAVEGSVDARLIEVLLQKQAVVHSALDIDALDDEQKKNLLFTP